MEIVHQPDTSDVCIVGSGAGGGMAAKVLSKLRLEPSPDLLTGNLL